MKITCIVCFMVFILGCSESNESNEPSIADTENFLRKKLNVKSSPNAVGQIEIQSFSREGDCKYRVHLNITNGSYDKDRKNDQIFFAKDLDPERVYDNGESVIIMETTEGKEKVFETFKVLHNQAEKVCKQINGTYSSKNKTCTSERHLNRAVFSYILGPAKNNIPKVIKAMRHLIHSCGGKGEIF